MADPLSLLQKYCIEGRGDEILEADGHIIFGDLAWPKDVKTNFRIYGTETDGKWEYYSLECLLYFLKNIKLTHPDYVKQAKGEVPIVHRPDRLALIGYLEGKKQKKDIKSIDPSAPLQMPTNFKRAAEEKKISGEPSVKKPRLENREATGSTPSLGHKDSGIGSEFKKRLADKLETSQEGGKLSINKANLKNLSEDLTTEKIAEIRAKLISNRRTRIKPEDADESSKITSVMSSMGDLEVSHDTRDLFARERVWRTRTSILQSSGKTFFKTVNSLLSSVKAREEGRHGKAPGSMGGHVMNNSSSGNRNPAAPAPPQRQNLPNYNRYDQEKFKQDTHGFNIETTGTFSGMTLKSVTEGSQLNRNKQNQPNKPGAPQQSGSQTPVTQNGTTSSPGRTLGSASPMTPAGKRPSRTPIIIIPAAPKSLITMFNAKDILQDLRFISTEDKKSHGSKRENELLIQRRKEGGLTVPYRVIDNPGKLTTADWDRVVAVFVMGQAWQFKGWPWDGNPTVIFSKIAAFHIMWDDSIMEKNIQNWAVNIIRLSREKRHLDRAKLMVFWESLDRYMINNKPHLRF